jgi:uncharacterized membrane protein YeaQ/YmgE (transglycosylase-associated protein family)
MAMGLIGWIIIGGLAGWIAGMIMNKHHNVFVNIIIGIIGAVIGGWLANMFGFSPSASGSPHIATFVVALIGSVILLFLLGLVNRPRT